MTNIDYTSTIERFSGFADQYDHVRPSSPDKLADLLLSLAECKKPNLVVDLGSGSGLSTRYWQHRATTVIGIEPSESMRTQAQSIAAENITYKSGFSNATGLDDNCADLVICGQSLHWMEPKSTFAESARILKDGGAFAAYDFDWPPATSSWKVDHTFIECLAHARKLERQHNTASNVHHWEKSGHLERIRQSGRFRHANEHVLHHTDQGDADRLVGVLTSQGCVQSLLKEGLSEEELHIDRLRNAANKAFAGSTVPWLWSVRIRIGIK